MNENWKGAPPVTGHRVSQLTLIITREESGTPQRRFLDTTLSLQSYISCSFHGHLGLWRLVTQQWVFSRAQPKKGRNRKERRDRFWKREKCQGHDHLPFPIQTFVLKCFCIQTILWFVRNEGKSTAITAVKISKYIYIHTKRHSQNLICKQQSEWCSQNNTKTTRSLH